MLAETIALLLLSAQAAPAPAPAPTPASAPGDAPVPAPTPAAAARPDADLDQVICRASEPVLGSRTARRRICRTRAQWMAFEEDRAQLRRDIQNSAYQPNRQ